MAFFLVVIASCKKIFQKYLNEFILLRFLLTTNQNMNQLIRVFSIYKDEMSL